jgi:hypothetical protein
LSSQRTTTHRSQPPVWGPFPGLLPVSRALARALLTPYPVVFAPSNRNLPVCRASPTGSAPQRAQRGHRWDRRGSAGRPLAVSPAGLARCPAERESYTAASRTPNRGPRPAIRG